MMSQLCNPSLVSLVVLAAVSVAVGVQAMQSPQRSTSLENPLPIEHRDRIRVVYQINTDDWKDGVGGGLYYLDKLAGFYDRAGIGRGEHRSIIGVFHGDAGYHLLNDAAYAKASKRGGENPNQALIRQLLGHGVRVEMCGSTMQTKGWKTEDLLPGIEVVSGAYPRIIDLQQSGYAYIRY